jgi:hypothetical protein
MTPRAIRRRGERQSWRLVESGFWRPGPYLELTAIYQYPEADAAVTQIAILEPGQSPTVYRVWDRGYRPETIAPILAARGFQVESCWADLSGTPYSAMSDSLAIVARREEV